MDIGHLLDVLGNCLIDRCAEFLHLHLVLLADGCGNGARPLLDLGDGVIVFGADCSLDTGEGR